MLNNELSKADTADSSEVPILSTQTPVSSADAEPFESNQEGSKCNEPTNEIDISQQSQSVLYEIDNVAKNDLTEPSLDDTDYIPV